MNQKSGTLTSAVVPADISSAETYEKITAFLDEGDIPNAIDLFERLAEDYERGVHTPHNAAIETGVPAFLSTFLAKSGGTYLHNHLVATGVYDLQHSTHTRWDMARAYFIPSRLRLFLKGGTCNHTHMRPLPWNVTQMKVAGVRRFWIHARDPRQSAVSTYWHGRGEGQGSDPHLAARRIAEDLATREARKRGQTVGVPDPFALDYDQQLRVHFDERIGWLTEWSDIRPQLPFDVLVTTHEQMVADMVAFEETVLHFFDAPDWMSGAFGAVLPHDRFRKGSTDEWKATIGQETKDWMAERLPQRVADFYRWQI
ncbi:MAG: hypothetical protein ABL866_16650 [Devosia sp.]